MAGCDGSDRSNQASWSAPELKYSTKFQLQWCMYIFLKGKEANGTEGINQSFKKARKGDVLEICDIFTVKYYRQLVRD